MLKSQQQFEKINMVLATSQTNIYNKLNKYTCQEGEILIVSAFRTSHPFKGTHSLRFSFLLKPFLVKEILKICKNYNNNNNKHYNLTIFFNNFPCMDSIFVECSHFFFSVR